MNRIPLIVASVIMLSTSATAQTDNRSSSITVQVTGIKSDSGEIGCALFSTADGFPMKPERAVRRFVAAKQSSVTCSFDNVSAGRYALAVSHDLNGNRKTDTNFIGLPREDWGVSNGVRPSMRAPRFAEAAFSVSAGEAKRVSVVVDR